MSRTFQRSFRLDDDLKPYLHNLPKGTSNSLVNLLLMRFFTDEALRNEMLGLLKDQRFKSWKPLTTAPEPEEPKIEEPVVIQDEIPEVEPELEPEDFVAQEETEPEEDILPGW